MDSKEQGEPGHSQGHNTSNDDGCIFCACFGHEVCLQCQDMAEVRAGWARNELDDSDTDTPLDVDDESDTSFDLNDIENVDETCTAARNVSSCRISRERVDLDRCVFETSYSNVDETCIGARNVIAYCASNVSLYGVTMKGLKYKPIIPDDIFERDNDTESDPEMPPLEEAKENKEDSDEDSDDLPPLEVM